MRASRKHRLSGRPRTGRPRAGRLRRDGWRALVSCLCLLFVFAFGAHVGGWSPLAEQPGVGQQPPDTEDLAIGTILIVPLYGNVCGQRLIDNATWRIWDNGVVQCDVFLSQETNSQARQLSALRVDVIRAGFTRR